MDKPLTKAQIRRQIEQQTADYLDHGGHVLEVPRGVSAWVAGESPPPTHSHAVAPPRGERTYVPEVVAAIEARRARPPKTKTLRGRGAANRPRKKLIYDDFGEPLRWEWVED